MNVIKLCNFKIVLVTTRRIKNNVIHDFFIVISKQFIKSSIKLKNIVLVNRHNRIKTITYIQDLIYI